MSVVLMVARTVETWALQSVPKLAGLKGVLWVDCWADKQAELLASSMVGKLAVGWAALMAAAWTGHSVVLMAEMKVVNLADLTAYV